MAENVILTFADGSIHPVQVADGEGDATAKAIMDRSGDYNTGWIKTGNRRWQNLATVVVVEVMGGEPPLILG